MEKRAINITLETAKQMYKSTDSNIQKLALSAYPELEEPKYPKWDELPPIQGYWIYCDSKIVKGTSSDNHFNFENKHVWPTKELAEAALALSQLLQLRDAYNRMEKGGDDRYYVIYLNTIEGDVLEVDNNKDDYKYLFTFNTKKLRDAFLENNRELLEIAKPLL